MASDTDGDSDGVYADWLDLRGLARSPYFGINVHIGATYDDRAATAERFRAAVCELSPGARARLTVENDDEQGLWGVADLVTAVSDHVGVPVVFDYHHHSFSDRGLTYREGFDRAADTWDCRPAVHYSDTVGCNFVERFGTPGCRNMPWAYSRQYEPACLHGEDVRPQAHAEYVARVPDWLRAEADVMVEAGGKERSLLRLRERRATDS